MNAAEREVRACGRVLRHPAHLTIQGRVAYQCPGVQAPLASGTPMSGEQLVQYVRAELDGGVSIFAASEVTALLARIAELEAERHSTNEALSDAAEAIREKDARLAAVRDAVAEAFMCPDEDCDGHLPKLEQILGGLDLLRDAEAGGLRG